MIYYVFVIFPKMINDIFRFLQVEILTSATIIILFLKFFCVILITMVQYFFFLYYKELKYQYILERPNKGYVIKDNNDEPEKEQFVNKKEKMLSNIHSEN